MPGAKNIYNMLQNNKEEALYIVNNLKGSSENLDGEKSGVADDKTYVRAMGIMYDWLLSKLPVAVCVIAGILAFIGYIVELAKYFYISPFVVAFALTTKKTHKILDFLVTGLTVFFKPILMVVFIALSLFIYTIVQDIFLYYTNNQFAQLAEINDSENISKMILPLIATFMQILGSLGATYVMWKLILTGPTWAMKLVGVDNAQNDMISEALSQRMDRAGFRM
jgi:hypothetical protein